MSINFTRDIYLLQKRFYILGISVCLLITGLAALLLLRLKFSEIPPLVPLWYTLPWGLPQLTPPINLWLLPATAFALTLTNAILVELFLRKREEVLAEMTLIINIVSAVFLNLSLFRIIRKVSPLETLPWFFEQRWVLPFLCAFLLSLLLTPWVIKIAQRFGLVDDPRTHKHPGMLLLKPTPRMGAVPIYISLLISGLLFLPKNNLIFPIYLAAALAVVIGIIDDKYNLNPYLRLAGLFFVAAIPVLSGISILFIGNPFGAIFNLDLYRTPFTVIGARPIILPADALTILWILWVMNMLSWSNGVDGQFPGIVAIAAVIIALLGKRFINFDPTQSAVVLLAFLTAGAVLGTLPFTWHPSRILYGFGATSLGLILAVLSILSIAKVSTSSLILMVPTLDALFVIFRRLKHHRSPVWGDRGHLHHKLLDWGWSQRQVAVFYWIVTAVFGSISLLASGREKILATLSAGGFVAFVLTLANRESLRFPRLNRLQVFFKKEIKKSAPNGTN